MTTCLSFLKILNIYALVMAISVPFASIALADGNDFRQGDGKGGGNDQPSGAATSPISDNGSNSASVSFEYFPGGYVKSVTLHCFQGAAPRVDVEGGVVRQSCQGPAFLSSSSD
jgi:hypothetical protein